MAIIETATPSNYNNIQTSVFNSVIIIKADNQNDDDGQDDDSRYLIFITLSSFFVILILSLLLYQLYCNQSKSSYGCCRRLQRKLWWLSDYDDYNFQVAHTNGYIDNEDDPCKSLLNAKLHINKYYEKEANSNRMNSNISAADALRNVYSV